MAKVIHVMIRVLEEAPFGGLLRPAFGLKVADRYAFDSFTLVYLSNMESPFEVELRSTTVARSPTISARDTASRLHCRRS